MSLAWMKYVLIAASSAWSTSSSAFMTFGLGCMRTPGARRDGSVGGRRREEPGLGDRELGPALAGPDRELVHQRDRVGVVVTRPHVDPALVLEAGHDLAP